VPVDGELRTENLASTPKRLLTISNRMQSIDYPAIPQCLPDEIKDSEIGGACGGL
jgi:hypothetical protein